VGILDVRDGDRGVRHPVIDDRRSGAVPGGSVCVYAAVSNRCCQLVGQFGNRRPRPRTPSPSPSTESTPASKLFFYYKDTLTQPTKTNFLRPRFAALRVSSHGTCADRTCHENQELACLFERRKMANRPLWIIKVAAVFSPKC